MKALLEQKSKEILEEVIEIRRHIHQNPELSFAEHETSKFIQSKLTEWGISFKAGWVETGIVASIEGKDASRWVGVRADMDALPIQEENEVDYASTNPGVMHACGHDVHSSVLLGTAKVLHELRDQLNVNVKLVFQPGEEKLPGGANLMIQEGVLENPAVEEMFALHVFPELECGKVGLKSGMYMASTDEIYITVHGKGGHGAMPHLNIDPVLISSHLIVSLQQIVSRVASPTVPSVLSFGRIEGLGATNVIPDKVELQGTFRTMNEEWRAKAHEKIKSHAIALCESMGAKVDVDIRVGYPYLENDPVLTEKSRDNLKEQFGEDNVVDLPIRMTAEDFSYFSQKVPATFIRLGVRNEEKGIVHGIHTSKFDVDEHSLAIGIQSFLAILFNK